MRIASRPGRFLLSLLLLSLSLSATAAERTVYFVNDAQGSPVAAMDQQGEVLWRESYAPFGERRTKAADNNGKPAYTGKPEDADTSLVYMHARMYDPETARFTGIDPQGYRDDSPQSFGRYLYANNAPYVYVDPDGELPILIPVAVFIAKEGAGIAFESATGVPAFFSMKGLSKAVAEAGKDMAARSAKNAASASATKAIPSAGGVIRQFEQTAERIYYRVYSEGNAVGKWLTAVPPKSSAWAQEALSLPPGNKATMIQEVLVPAGTRLERSRATSVPEWGRNRGGAEQFKLLDEIPRSNFGAGKPLP